MTLRKIALVGEPILRTRAREVSFDELIAMMVDADLATESKLLAASA